jgi:fructosamine-3-kinase
MGTPAPPALSELSAATALVRQCLGRPLSVLEVEALEGGMIYRVEGWRTDGEPAWVVCKISGKPDDAGLRQEYGWLGWCRKNTSFPVPRVYGLLERTGEVQGSCLLMERLTGRHLGAARLSTAGMEHFQRQFAEHLARLHHHRATGYGNASRGESMASWAAWYRPILEDNYHDAREKISAEARSAVEEVLSNLEEWLGEPGPPTAVHGDLWANNILVDGEVDRPRISGFIDGHLLFADVEFELAYLTLWGTSDERFFEVYTQHHRLREGFERRCRVYWINTLLLHVWMFGQGYVERTERVARELMALR